MGDQSDWQRSVDKTNRARERRAASGGNITGIFLLIAAVVGGVAGLLICCGGPLLSAWNNIADKF